VEHSVFASLAGQGKRRRDTVGRNRPLPYYAAEAWGIHNGAIREDSLAPYAPHLGCPGMDDERQRDETIRAHNDFGCARLGLHALTFKVPT
jgi:hypothetical protein